MAITIATTIGITLIVAKGVVAAAAGRSGRSEW
jgi:hypothetical protein